MSQPSHPHNRDAKSLVTIRARDGVSLGALAVVTGGSVFAGGDQATIAALGGLLLACILPALPAYGLGQLALVSTGPELASPLFIGGQAALLVVLFEPLRRHRLPGGYIRLLLALGLCTGAVVASYQRGLVITGGLLCLVVGAAVYLRRRLTMVQLDLVSTASSRPAAQSSHDSPEHDG